MIHYHGLPITPESIVPQAMSGAHFFLSFANADSTGAALSCCSSFAVDNGAYPKWKRGEPQECWSGFYDWLKKLMRLPSFDFAVIPDVIDGGEEDNDALIAEWPFSRNIGSPVWHLHESLDRLERLCGEFERVCLGSSGEYSRIGTEAWWERMAEAMGVMCDPEGFPRVKIHGLRMLNPEIVLAFPFKSCDSTNLARNIGLDSRWNGSYSPPTKAARAAVLRARIEGVHSPEKWVKRGAEYYELF